MIAVNTILVDVSRMSDESQIHVRVPNSLKAALSEAAKASGRSQNAEIVFRLLESLSLKDAGYTGGEPPQFSGIELGLIGMWRMLDEEHRRSLLVVMKSLVHANNAP